VFCCRARKGDSCANVPHGVDLVILVAEQGICGHRKPSKIISGEESDEVPFSSASSGRKYIRLVRGGKDRNTKRSSG